MLLLSKGTRLELTWRTMLPLHEEKLNNIVSCNIKNLSPYSSAFHTYIMHNVNLIFDSRSMLVHFEINSLMFFLFIYLFFLLKSVHLLLLNTWYFGNLTSL
ncbi:unnamed protein product [Musa acuminata subsp. malaccensis]|uniref:(wild Malaysian banana) hypothetical protein n=1 Tax=Musa acuminata subsp. malaccensis TaxID=214687 RepID=A0A8D6ZSI8_MUSAM|nr:unnamed protein product [Musa acuminata subsp. malaccensis]